MEKGIFETDQHRRYVTNKPLVRRKMSRETFNNIFVVTTHDLVMHCDRTWSAHSYTKLSNNRRHQIGDACLRISVVAAIVRETAVIRGEIKLH